jgi:hypothetical protein
VPVPGFRELYSPCFFLPHTDALPGTEQDLDPGMKDIYRNDTIGSNNVTLWRQRTGACLRWGTAGDAPGAAREQPPFTLSPCHVLKETSREG